MNNNAFLSRFRSLMMLVAAGLMNGFSAPAEEIDRSILPIRHPEQAPITEMDARNATKPKPFNVEAP